MSIVEKAFINVARLAARSTAKKLAAQGLKFEDILVYNEDVEAALHRIPEAEKIARQRRIKRAIDLSSKHKELAANEQTDLNTVFDSYLMKEVEKATQERLERQIINHF